MFIQAAFDAAGVTSKIQTAGSGYEAIAYLSGDGKYSDRRSYEYPDFVISDLKMPGIDGFGVLEFLKKNPQSATIPTIILSGSQDNDDIKKAYLLGASSYHVKPSAPSALHALMKALHDYWILAEIPQPPSMGEPLETDQSYKLGGKVFSRLPGSDLHGTH